VGWEGKNEILLSSDAPPLLCFGFKEGFPCNRKEHVMPRTRLRRPASSRKTFLLQKPNGQLTPRVQQVGPEHFGIVAIDCAKARSRYLLSDFYGQVLLSPTTVSHTSGDLQAAIERVRQALAQHDVRDVVVAIERTGEYHRPVQRAFRQAGFETRLVHPFTSKQYRQPADPGNKTDDTDLAAIFRATTHGFGLCEPTWPDDYRTLQLFRRHRSDLVAKNSILRCQIREILHAAMPGYAECFSDLFRAPAPLVLARHTTSAEAVCQAGLAGLQQIITQAGCTCRPTTYHKVLAWAEQAPPSHPQSGDLRRILQTLDDDRLEKTRHIVDLEGTLSHLVLRTPYALLLAIPGVNIVTIADLAAELGPIQLYLNANAITGRAGLMPSRYQSDHVDQANGPLRHRGHRRLRAVLMQTADNLVTCNHYFRARAEVWSRAGKDPRWIRVKVAKIFTRVAFAMVAGRRLFTHPCCQPRSYILGKILAFHSEHHTAPLRIRQDLEALVDQLPANARASEAHSLQEQWERLANARRGPQPLATILPLVLARLGRQVVESNEHEGARP
jgi:transposase